MPAQRAKGTRYAKYHTKLDNKTWASLMNYDEKERQRNKDAWAAHCAALPDDCFADDVQDSDHSTYYSRSFMEGRRLDNE